MAKGMEDVKRLVPALSRWSNAFRIPGDSIQVLTSPTDYFNFLQEGLCSASKTIQIASLYCGVGDGHEKQFLSGLKDALSRLSNSGLQSFILLDALRGTRNTKNASGNGLRKVARACVPTMAKMVHTENTDLLQGTDQSIHEGAISSSASQLCEKVDKCSKVALFHTPALHGMLKRMLPPRVNEIVGVSHVKAYIFDDVLLVSGANLSSDYFTRRQDRYYKFHSSAMLEWTTSFLKAIGNHSYQLNFDNSLGPCPAKVNPLKQPRAFCKSLRDTLMKLVSPKIGSPSHFTAPLKKAEIEEGMIELSTEEEDDTWVFPALQMGCAGIRQDEEMTISFIESVRPGGTLVLTSPYFNLAKPLRRALANTAHVNIQLLTSSASANGFFGAKGAAGFIPTAYFLLQRNTWRFLNKAWAKARPKLNMKRSLCEYVRPGWQYHAKGMWYIPPGENLPLATTIGSPNLGYRSHHRDLECEFFIITTNAQLRKAMRAELDNLLEHTVDISETHLQPLQGVSYRARMAARLMRSFL